MIKLIRYKFFKIIYGEITTVLDPNKSKNIFLKKILFEEKKNYNFYNIRNGRIFSDTVNDTAYILNSCLIKNISFQYRMKKNLQIINGNILDNFVITKGTPKFLRKLNGNVFSLLSGGAGKNNYWHWMFDVLPKIGMLEKVNLKKKPDYYLLPSLKKKYQKESLLILNIPSKKLINGQKDKHINCNNLLAVDHPNLVNNNPSKSMKNIPIWIIKWLRKKYIKNKLKDLSFPKRIFINRENDSVLERRKLINNQEIKKLLIELGFKIITLSDYTFQNQIKLFNNANLIVGLHGAGFANIIFSKPKTKIIELQSKYSGNVILKLAKKCNLNYKRIIDINTKGLKHQDNHVKINTKKLRKIINY